MINNTYIKKMKVTVDADAEALVFKPSSPEKISTKPKRAFSLPASSHYSCPGETKACTGCYAMKGRHIFLNVQSNLAGNWKLLRRFENKDESKKCAEELIKIIPNSATIFRIHESGDFHSNFSIDAWAQVIKKMPRVIFWAYTRSFDLDFSKLVKLKNFYLLTSIDKYNKKEAIKFSHKYKSKLAYGPWSKTDKLPDNSIVCPATNGKISMKGACERCLLCLSDKTTKSIVFIKH
jgi:hypothetical protein